MNLRSESPPAEQITRELGGETLLWHGRPARGLKRRRTDILAFLIGCVFFGFPLYLLFAVFQEAPMAFILILIVMIGAGVHLLVGRYFTDAWRRSRLYYGITSQRIIIVSEFWGRSVRSLPLVRLNYVTLTHSTGTIEFHKWGAIADSYAAFGWVYRIPCFELLDDAKRVYSLILDARQRSGWSEDRIGST